MATIKTKSASDSKPSNVQSEISFSVKASINKVGECLSNAVSLIGALRNTALGSLDVWLQRNKPKVKMTAGSTETVIDSLDAIKNNKGSIQKLFYDEFLTKFINDTSENLLNSPDALRELSIKPELETIQGRVRFGLTTNVTKMTEESETFKKFMSDLKKVRGKRFNDYETTLLGKITKKLEGITKAKKLSLLEHIDNVCAPLSKHTNSICKRAITAKEHGKITASQQVQLRVLCEKFVNDVQEILD